MPSLARTLGLLCLTSYFAIGQGVFEKLDGVPRGWVYVREANPDEPINLRISLREQNLGYFEQLVLDISTPGHSKYGQHLEGHEVSDILSPSPEASSTVLAWLREHDLPTARDGANWVNFWTTVAQANDILNTTFVWYENQELQQEKLRTLQYTVPDNVALHINFIEPTIKFPSLQPMRSSIHSTRKASSNRQSAPLTVTGKHSTSVLVDASCDYEITPTCLLQLYNVYYTASATNGNNVSYASFLKEYARYTDLKSFEQQYATWAKGTNFSVVQFNGGGNKQKDSVDDSTEANLDNQYILSISYPTPVTEYSTGGCGPLKPDYDEPKGSCDNEPYIVFLKGVLALPNSQLPQVLSVSYGEDEQAWPIAMANQVCTMFSQLGARGVSVLFASGDFGPGNTCTNNAGTKLKFVPAFPASCPWVTVVGATENIGPEQAADFSGGGFSNYFGRPSYQSSAVSTYLTALGTTQQKYYNASGRGYPDVAAQGVSFEVVDKGDTELVDGTSCATPTFAAIVALLNSARLSAGQSTLGFLNPFLYSTGHTALNDITEGGSIGCDGYGGEIPYAGWNATKGWDPVTGLGTPNFGKLLKLTSPGACNTKGVLGVNPASKTCAAATSTSKSTSSKATTTTAAVAA